MKLFKLLFMILFVIPLFYFILSITYLHYAQFNSPRILAIILPECYSNGLLKNCIKILNKDYEATNKAILKQREFEKRYDSF